MKLLLCTFFLFLYTLHTWGHGTQSFNYLESLIGKPIVIPTYENGNRNLKYVYVSDAWNDGIFTPDEQVSTDILGRQVVVQEYRYIFTGKVETSSINLRIRVDDELEDVILHLPLYLHRKDGNAAKILEDLFYQKPYDTDKSLKGEIIANYYTPFAIRLHEVPFGLFEKAKSYYHHLYFINVHQWLARTPHIMRDLTFRGFSYLDKYASFTDYEKDPHIVYHIQPYKAINRDRLVAEFISMDDYRIKRYLEIENESTFDHITTPSDYARQCLQAYAGDSLYRHINQLKGKTFYIRQLPQQKYMPVIARNQQLAGMNDYVGGQISNRYYKVVGIRPVLRPGEGSNYYYIPYLVLQDNDAFKPYKGIALTSDSLAYYLQPADGHPLSGVSDKNEKQHYFDILADKYGDKNAKWIVQGMVKPDFTKPMCEAAWGMPRDKTSTVTDNGWWELFIYGTGNYLYFKNGKLAVIQY